MIVEDKTEFPKTVSSLRKVKGIGDYTAGAIASIAFNEVGSLASVFSKSQSSYVTTKN